MDMVAFRMMRALIRGFGFIEPVVFRSRSMVPSRFLDGVNARVHIVRVIQ